ncbi:MAG: metallophosphoesterase [Clostridiales bacterium]
MKILLFSDSHGNINNMLKAIKKHKNVNTIIHLGDMVKDIREIENRFNDINIEYVKGNNDWTHNISDYKMIELESKKIYITHGHRYSVKFQYERICGIGHSLNADAVFFGHTHQPEEFFSDNILFLNPGSIAGGRYASRATYCLIEIKDGEILTRFESIKF